ncbi:MAG: ABC transporter substrate-binding protein, partial [Actinomycetota bacterium]
KQDTAGTRAAVLTACDKAFAIVGSMSAFDQGGASSGEQCGIPEIPAITTSLQKITASTVYPAYPNRPDYFISAEGNYIKEKYPDAIDHAAIIWLAADVPRASAAAREKGLEKAGFTFVYRQEVQPVEPNYAPYVFDMQRLGVEYVTMIGNFQSIARLLDAMRQQGFNPVKDFDSVVYDPDFIADAGPSAEGSLFFINTAMIEEIGSNPEMQLYASWLKRVAPGAQPDYFGLYAWSAGRLFAEAMTNLGPSPTRKGLIAELSKFGTWDGNGIHAEHDISKKISSPCILYGSVSGGRFVRKDPASSWMCDKGPVIKV